MKPLMCALGALFFLNGCGGASAESSTLPSEVATADLPDAEAVRVEVVTLEPSDASITLELPGEIQGSEDALLAAALGGFVEEVRVDNGDEVRRGDVLVVVDRRTRAAQAAQAEAQLQQAEADLRRQQALGELASAATLQQLETAVAIATAGAELARTQLSRATIRAPFDGVIGGIDIEVGEVANPGAPVARLVKLDPIKVQLSVSDRDVVALKPGMAARVTTAARGDLREGVIAHVAPVADLSTRSFLVDVEAANPERDLLPGMIARVHVEEMLAEGVVVIPQDWIVTRLDGYGLFVEVDGRAAWRAVTLGDVVRGQVVVDSGLAPGDRVVVTGQHTLADGDPLLIAREGQCCTQGRAQF